MRLHNPLAQWRATAHNPQIRLSLTLDTLPPGKPVVCIRTDRHSWHLVVRDGEAYGRVVDTYAWSRGIPPWVGLRLFSTVGVVHPADDPGAYRANRWWDPDWEIGTADVHMMESAGAHLIDRWPHAWLLN